MLDEANAVRDDGMPRTWQSMLTVDPFVNHSLKKKHAFNNEWPTVHSVIPQHLVYLM